MQEKLGLVCCPRMLSNRESSRATAAPKDGAGSVMLLACMAAKGSGSLVFTDMTKAAGLNVNCLKLYYVLRFSQILQNPPNGASWCR